METLMNEVIEEEITKKKVSENKKRKIYKKIKKRKEKNMEFEFKEVFFVFIIFASLLMIPFLNEKIEVNEEEKGKNIEQIYKTLQVEE